MAMAMAMGLKPYPLLLSSTRHGAFFSYGSIRSHAQPLHHSHIQSSKFSECATRTRTRATRGDGDGGDENEKEAATSGRREPESGRSFVSPDLEEESPSAEKPRPFWQGRWGFGGKKSGFGGRGKESRGQRELEELDMMLEGVGFDFQWKDVLEPSVENALALLLTALLLYAVVLIGWQLLVVAAAITLSALKYAVLAAILLGVLVFLI